MASQRKIEQAEGLIDFLKNNHGSNIVDIRNHLRVTYGWAAYEAPDLIGFIRNVYGNHAVVCWYSYRDGTYVYGLARSLQEGRTYVRVRTRQLRNTAVNVSTIVDRLLAEFPASSRTERAALRRHRDDLRTVVDILDRDDA